MKITKRQLRRIIKEEKALIEAYNSMSTSGKSLANSIKGKFLRMYPDAKIGIDSRGGFITVNGKKAIDMSQASGRGRTDEEMIEMMHAAYAETHVDDDVGTEARRGSRPGEHKLDFGKDIGTYNYRNEGAKVKVTKRQLKRIIREEKARVRQAESPLDDLKMLDTVIKNLTEMALGYDVDEETKSDLLSQVELLNGVYSSMYGKTLER